MSTSALTAKSNSFIDKLFVPHPDEDKKKPKGMGDHIAKWANSTDGAWSFFKVFDHAFDYVKLLPNIPEKVSGYIQKARSITDLSGSVLSFPTLLSDVNNLRRSVTNLSEAAALPESDDSRSSKITRAAKKSILDGFTLTNTASQAMIFLRESKFLELSASASRCVDWIFNLTSLVTDGAELAEEAYNVHRNQGQMATAKSEKEQTALQEKINLSWLKIVKDVASVALSVIGIIALVFGALTQGLVIIAPIALGLSTIWLAMKISAYFYERIVKERNKSV